MSFRAPGNLIVTMLWTAAPQPRAAEAVIAGPYWRYARPAGYDLLLSNTSGNGRPKYIGICRTWRCPYAVVDRPLTAPKTDGARHALRLAWSGTRPSTQSNQPSLQGSKYPFATASSTRSRTAPQSAGAPCSMHPTRSKTWPRDIPCASQAPPCEA
jgi:hypothetical protein